MEPVSHILASQDPAELLMDIMKDVELLLEGKNGYGNKNANKVIKRIEGD